MMVLNADVINEAFKKRAPQIHWRGAFKKTERLRGLHKEVNMNTRINNYVRRIWTTTGLGILIGALGWIWAAHSVAADGVTPRMIAGLVLWYPLMGFIVGLIGPLDRHPLFPGIKMKVLRGLGIGLLMNGCLSFIVYSTFQATVALSFPFLAGLSPHLLLPLEGMVIGALMDYAGTRIGGEGKALLSLGGPEVV